MVNHFQTISPPMKLGQFIHKLYKQLHNLSNIVMLVYKCLILWNTSWSLCMCKNRKINVVWCKLFRQFFDKRLSYTFHIALWLMSCVTPRYASELHQVHLHTYTNISRSHFTPKSSPKKRHSNCALFSLSSKTHQIMLNFNILYSPH